MNAERLHELADFLLREENRLQIQQQLDRLQSALNQLGGSPGDQDFQNQLASSRAALASTMASANEEMTPATLSAIDSIGGTPFFTGALVGRAEGSIEPNGMTPHVAASEIEELVKERKQYLENLLKLNEGMSALKIDVPKTYPGEVEVGFLLPSKIFDGIFIEFTDELRQLDFVVQNFTELATGKRESPRLRQLSSTDPFIVVGVTIAGAHALGSTITWLLDNWKKALEIKALYDQAKELNLSADLLKGFENSIKSHIDSAIEKNTEQLMSTYGKDSIIDKERANELNNGIRRSMKILLTRIEGGMQVEMRYLPAPDAGEVVVVEGGEERQRYAAEVQEIARRLSFPKVTSEPVLRVVWHTEEDGGAKA